MINKTSKFDLSFVGKLLIVISFALISYGVFLDVNNNKKSFDPIKGVKNNSSDFTSVSVDSNSSDNVNSNNIESTNSTSENKDTENLEQVNRIDDTNKSLK